MLFGFLTVLIMLGVSAYALWSWGALRAFCVCCNTVLAGLVAFNFFEPAATFLDPHLESSGLGGVEDAFCLLMIFGATFVALHLITKFLANKWPDYHPYLQRGGAAFFGLIAGYLLAGVLVVALDTLPFGPTFPGFQGKVAPEARWSRLRRVLPPDRVWLAMMHRASVGSFTRGGPTFDADGSFEFRYQRLRRHAATPPPKGE
jgi:Colicin V production protein